MSPAPEILEVLGREALTLEALLAQLTADYALVDADPRALAERLRRARRGRAGARGVRHRFDVRIGPVGFRVGSDWRAPVAALADLYRDYPRPDGIADFTVRLLAARPWRRVIRPSVTIGGDYTSCPTQRRCRCDRGCSPPRWG